ncbi:FecR domain-containing protein [Parapedobacter tibetensis]|uniref:FecR domain-containing protein n=1 Tax=Parapedobacter tibetensis TaxID=2972951 RepID=UPI00214D90D5|nr:FecR domain-containing protein [Parapedobacter tibetensis]
MDEVLLTKYLLKETSEEETAAVRKWIAAHPDNEKHYSQLRLVWDASQTLAGKSDVDEHEAWLRFMQRRERVNPSLSWQSKGLIRRLGWLRIAATLIFVSGASLIGYYFLVQNGSQRYGSTYETANAVNTDTLADGSIITLNKYATLRFSQGPFQGKRLAELREGEVFFRVAPNHNKPFVIESGKVTVTVLGTSFHVKRKGDETEVIVESGQVKVEGLSRMVELGPRQKVTINTQTQQFDEGMVDDLLHNYYVSNQFVLDNTPLWRVVEVLREAYGVEIIIVNDKIRNLPMTTTLHQNTLEDMLHLIAKTLRITVEKQGNNIILK